MTTQPVVLFYGNPWCAATEHLYQAVRGRDKCRALYLEQEHFPRRAPFLLTVGQELSGDYVEVWGEAVAIESVRSVCINGIAVPADRFSDLNETDTNYAQTESWATLHALLASWQHHTRVVNRLSHRDALISRFAELWTLSNAGLTVPDLLVTSDPDQARAFDADHPPGVLFKSVYGQSLPQPLGPEQRERLAGLTECPIHLEAVVPGKFCRLVAVGDDLRCAVAIPDSVQQHFRALVHELDLHLAELHLIQADDRWTAVRLIPFVSPEGLVELPGLLEASVALLEGGP
ncbi:MAG TPA: hypothetical protein VGO93_19715 [Candidatus Xenobia bacterium]